MVLKELRPGDLFILPSFIPSDPFTLDEIEVFCKVLPQTNIGATAESWKMKTPCQFREECAVIKLVGR